MLKGQGTQEIIPGVQRGISINVYARVCAARHMKYICHDHLPKVPTTLTTPTVACDIVPNYHNVEG